MWTEVFQNDFAARADWCVKPFHEANHQPVVRLTNSLNMTLKGGPIRLLV